MKLSLKVYGQNKTLHVT